MEERPRSISCSVLLLAVGGGALAGVRTAVRRVTRRVTRMVVDMLVRVAVLVRVEPVVLRAGEVDMERLFLGSRGPRAR